MVGAFVEDLKAVLLASEMLWRGRRLYIDPDCTTSIVAGHAEE
ncbi:MAG TPA: hypothetical protein VFY54_09805 [Rubrobacter sp.]|nr:hypothetical protein [Rubrobacter sp.]